MGINEGIAADGQRQIQKGRGQYDGFAKTVKTGLDESEESKNQAHSCRVATKANLRLAIVAVPAIVPLSVVKRNASTEICELARSISSLA